MENAWSSWAGICPELKYIAGLMLFLLAQEKNEFVNMQKTTTVKKEIFVSSLIFLIITMTAFSILFAMTLYKTETAKAKNIIRQRNSAINFFIDGHFTEIKNIINLLASDSGIRNAIQLDSNGRQNILDRYRQYLENDKRIAYIYSGYCNGLLLINDYTPPEIYDPVNRPWYKSAVAAAPKVAMGVPYQDIKDREWLISTGKAFIGEETNCQGVVAIDNSIQTIVDLLAKRSLDYKTSYSYIINQDQKIIIHHEKKHVNKILSEAIKTPVVLDKDKGEFSYAVDDVEKRAYYSKIPETGWTVVTVVEKWEILYPSILRIILTVLIPVLLAVFFAVGQSKILSRRFSKPLFKLKNDINSIISGKKESASDYRYPDNEIGFIAKEIGRLTEHELYKRALALEDTNTILKKTIEELNTLQGIIPICSSCKKIRDDEGSWNQLESYIERHSDAAFSHGICPDCMEKLYGNDKWYKNRRNKKKK